MITTPQPRRTAAGTVLEKIKYDVYGRITDFHWWNGAGYSSATKTDGFVTATTYFICSLTKNPYLFQGQRLDEESGLYYMKNRYYDPVHGRFISRDPEGFADGPNLYAFVNNNPINFVDPLGLEEELSDMGVSVQALIPPLGLGKEPPRGTDALEKCVREIERNLAEYEISEDIKEKLSKLREQEGLIESMITLLDSSMRAFEDSIALMEQSASEYDKAADVYYEAAYNMVKYYYWDGFASSILGVGSLVGISHTPEEYKLEADEKAAPIIEAADSFFRQARSKAAAAVKTYFFTMRIGRAIRNIGKLGGKVTLVLSVGLAVNDILSAPDVAKYLSERHMCYMNRASKIRFQAQNIKKVLEEQKVRRAEFELLLYNVKTQIKELLDEEIKKKKRGNKPQAKEG